MCFSILNLTDICIIDLDGLIFGQRLGSVFFSVHSNTDRSMAAPVHESHPAPQHKRKNKDPAYKNKFFFLQGSIPSFCYNMNES